MNATTIAQLNDPQAMRALVLERLAERAETVHPLIMELYGDAAPTRLAAVVAVITEAAAYWQVEQHGPMTVEIYREIAENMEQAIGEQIRSIIVSRVEPHALAASRASVVADMRGPSDEV